MWWWGEGTGMCGGGVRGEGSHKNCTSPHMQM